MSAREHFARSRNGTVFFTARELKTFRALDSNGTYLSTKLGDRVRDINMQFAEDDLRRENQASITKKRTKMPNTGCGADNPHWRDLKFKIRNAEIAEKTSRQQQEQGSRMDTPP
jgi:hypothetical protein